MGTNRSESIITMVWMRSMGLLNWGDDSYCGPYWNISVDQKNKNGTHRCANKLKKYTYSYGQLIRACQSNDKRYLWWARCTTVWRSRWVCQSSDNKPRYCSTRTLVRWYQRVSWIGCAICTASWITPVNTNVLTCAAFGSDYSGTIFDKMRRDMICMDIIPRIRTRQINIWNRMMITIHVMILVDVLMP